MLVLVLVATSLAGPFDGDPLREVFKHPFAPGPLAGSASRARQPGWDVVHYDVDVRLDPVRRVVTGEILVVAKATSDSPGDLVLHADGPDISSITTDGVDAAWTRSGAEVHVPAAATAGETVDVVVRYTAPGNADESELLGLHWGPPIHSFHEPDGARRWLVVYDDPADKATLDWHVTVPEGLVVVANGTASSPIANGDGTATWDFAFDAPIAPYLMVVHAGSFESRSLEGGSVPITTWASPSIVDDLHASLGDTAGMIDTFSGEFGPYPWSHYANVAAPFGGAMEHTTATTFGEGLRYDANAEYVNAHELAHHWWGDYVTCASWEEIWLNEGFASYGEALWYEEQIGFDGLRDYVAYQRDTYFAWHDYEGVFALYDPEYLWGGTVYDKGAAVLHMLRFVVGDEAFFAGLRRYAADHAHDNVTTLDLQAAMEAESGQDLAWFFDEWVYRAGDPAYTVGLTSAELPDGSWQIDVHVAQDGDPWRMPVEVEIPLADGSHIHERIEVGGSETVVSFCASAPPAALVFDPDGWQLYASLQRDDGAFVAAPDVCTPVDTDVPDTDAPADTDPADTGDATEPDVVAGGGCRGCQTGGASGLLGVAALVAALLVRRPTSSRG